MTYHAWIPILTNRLLFDYFIKKLEEEGQKVTEEEKKTLDKKLGKRDGKYYFRETHEDVKDKKFKAVISIGDKNAIDHVLIFDRENNLAAHASCSIEDNGLCTLELKYPEEKYAWKEHEMIEQFYILIRDVYHYHTHHEPHEEMLLKPVIAENKRDVVAKIITQYEQKIIGYHTSIRLDMGPEKDFNAARKLIVKAKGEMTYASHFVNVFKENIENPEAHLFVFSNALQSITILANEIESVYTAGLNTETVKLTRLITGLNTETVKLTRLIIGLTLVVVVLTLPIAIDATFGSLEHFDSMEISNIIKFFVSLFYLSTLLFIIYRLRDRIKEEFEKSYKSLIWIIISVAVATISILLYIY